MYRLQMPHKNKTEKNYVDGSEDVKFAKQQQEKNLFDGAYVNLLTILHYVAKNHIKPKWIPGKIKRESFKNKGEKWRANNFISTKTNNKQTLFIGISKNIHFMHDNRFQISFFLIVRWFCSMRI